MVRAFFAREGAGRGAEPGQGLVEYALILVLISVVVIGILTALGEQIGVVFWSIYDGLGGPAIGPYGP
jgi:pilus assembly protein Flp/PilA